MSDAWLEEDQRDRFLSFIEQADSIFSDGIFERDESLGDEAVLALALRAAELLGMEQAEISEFFEREFGIAGMTEGDLGTCLALAMLADSERRLKARCGGRS